MIDNSVNGSFGIHRYTLGFFSDLCVLSCSITLWIHASAFAKRFLTNQPWQTVSETPSAGESWAKIYENFQAIRSLSHTINSAVGTQVTLYTAESVIFYSLNLNAALTSKNTFRRIDMICFYVLTIGTFAISANICSQVFLCCTHHLRFIASCG